MGVNDSTKNGKYAITIYDEGVNAATEICEAPLADVVFAAKVKSQYHYSADVSAVREEDGLDVMDAGDKKWSYFEGEDSGYSCADAIRKGVVTIMADGTAILTVKTDIGDYSLCVRYIRRRKCGALHIIRITCKEGLVEAVPCDSALFNEEELKAIYDTFHGVTWSSSGAMNDVEPIVPPFVNSAVDMNKLYCCGTDKATNEEVVLTGYDMCSKCYIGTPVKYSGHESARPFIVVRDTDGFVPMLDYINAGGDDYLKSILRSGGKLDRTVRNAGQVHISNDPKTPGHILVIIGYVWSCGCTIAYDMSTGTASEVNVMQIPLFKDADEAMWASDGRRVRGKLLHNASVTMLLDNNDGQYGTNLGIGMNVKVITAYDIISDRYFCKSVTYHPSGGVKINMHEFTDEKAEYGMDGMLAVNDNDLRGFDMRFRKTPSIDRANGIVIKRMYGDDAKAVKELQLWYNTVASNKERGAAACAAEDYCRAAESADNIELDSYMRNGRRKGCGSVLRSWWTGMRLRKAEAVFMWTFGKIVKKETAVEFMEMLRGRYDEAHIRYAMCLGDNMRKKSYLLRDTVITMKNGSNVRPQKNSGGEK